MCSTLCGYYGSPKSKNIKLSKEKENILALEWPEMNSFQLAPICAILYSSNRVKPEWDETQDLLLLKWMHVKAKLMKFICQGIYCAHLEGV